MAKKSQPKLVHCRYPKCKFLHETTELKKDDAVKSGSSSYYHPDCYHTMQTVNKIKDIFYKEVNSTLTGKQIGQLVSIVNNMIFSKHIDVDYILFGVEYFIKNKPGALKYPGGVAYVVNDKDVTAAWEKEQDRKIRAEIKIAMDEKLAGLGNINPDDAGEIGGWKLPETNATYKSNRSKFSNVLGV